MTNNPFFSRLLNIVRKFRGIFKLKTQTSGNFITGKCVAFISSGIAIEGRYYSRNDEQRRRSQQFSVTRDEL